MIPTIQLEEHIVRETCNKEILYLHNEKIDLCCPHTLYKDFSLMVKSIYKDAEMTLIHFNLNGATDYILKLAESKDENETITDDIQIFANFPDFFNLIKEYKPRSLELYICSELVFIPPFEDFAGIDIKEISIIVTAYIWTLLMAGVHYEHYRHGGKKEDLYFSNYESKNIVKGDFYISLLSADLLTPDQFAGSYYTPNILSRLCRDFIDSDNLSNYLPQIASILRHDSKVIDDHIDECMCSMVWNTLMWHLENIRVSGIDNITPKTVYTQYKEQQNPLLTAEDYQKAIDSQIDKYIHINLKSSDKAILVYTVERNGEIKLNRYVYKDACDIYNVVGEKYWFRANSDYLGIKEGTRKEITDVWRGDLKNIPIPDISFNLKEYRNIIKLEYELIPEIKEYIEDTVSFEGEMPCSPSNPKGEKKDVLTYPIWTMMILNNYEVCFYLGANSEMDTSTNWFRKQEFMSLTGRKFKQRAFSHNDVLNLMCFITEEEYNNPEFRDKYPKLAAIYKRGLKLYHNYVAYGEQNPMAEVMQGDTR